MTAAHKQGRWAHFLDSVGMIYFLSLKVGWNQGGATRLRRRELDAALRDLQAEDACEG
jgi:hypothetical protein